VAVTREAVITIQQNAPLAREQGLNSVLAKAYALLGAFQHGPMTLRLSDLAQRSGVSKTSAYRLAEQLVELGMLARTDHGYQLGMSMFEFGHRVPLSAALGATARPILVDLATTLRATVHLAVLDGLDVLYVEKINGRRGFHSVSSVGGRLSPTHSASGKVLLADSPMREALLAGIEQRDGIGEHALAELRRELNRTESQRYGVERELIARDWKCLAVPVPDRLGHTIAALSALVPVTRNDEQAILQHLRPAAGAIGRHVRHRSA